MQPTSPELDLEDEIGNDKYEFFDTPESREEVYTITKALATYIHDQGIENLVLMDRAARPAYQALHRYWRAAYKDARMPEVFFINPKGFMTAKMLEKKDPINKSTIKTYFEVHAANTGDLMDPENIRDEDEILDDFTKTFDELLDNPQDDTLIFDVCLHSGKSMEPVLEVFREAGVPNLRVGVVDQHRQMNRRIKPDFVASGKTVNMWCMPFAQDPLVQKSFSRVHSETSFSNGNTDLDGDGQRDAVFTEKLQRGVRLRKEISRIMDHYLAADHNLPSFKQL